MTPIVIVAMVRYVYVIPIVLGSVFAIVLLLLHHTPLGTLVHEHIPDRPRRRLLLTSVGFFLTFACVRALTWSIHNNIGPFHNVEMGGRHIHHLALLLRSHQVLLVLAVRHFEDGDDQVLAAGADMIGAMRHAAAQR